MYFVLSYDTWLCSISAKRPKCEWGVSPPDRPIVGMVVTISPSFSLYRMVVFPAASSPTMRILISFLPIRLFSRLLKMFPMMTDSSHFSPPELLQTQVTNSQHTFIFYEVNM